MNSTKYDSFAKARFSRIDAHKQRVLHRKLQGEYEKISTDYADLKHKHTSETTLLTRQVQTLEQVRDTCAKQREQDRLVIVKLQDQLANAVKNNPDGADSLSARTSHLVAEINRKDKTIAKLEESRHIQKMTIENKMSDIADLNCKIIDLKSEIDTLITLKQPNIQIVTTGAILSVILNMVILYILLG